MELPEYRFADCVLDPARRELWRADVRQVIEPKPFDLLHYLLRHRDRVVSHDELLAVLWPDQPVKPGALARAVMLARRAVGESHIQTSSRIGYRFVGEVDRGPGHGSPLSLALLPFDNQTGDHQLDWIELGLMSLVARALAAQPGLDVALPVSVLAALESLPPDAPARDKAEALRRLLGARGLGAVRLPGPAPPRSGGGRGGGTAGDGAPPQGGLVSGTSSRLTDLASGLARQLAEALLPSLPAPPPGSELGDPLADEAMAHALQAATEERWTAAVNLMRVVLDMAPGADAAQLEMLRCQAALGEPTAQASGLALLRRAIERGDRRLQAHVEQALGRNALNQGAFEQARAHLARALEIAGNEEPSGWTIQTLLWQSSAALQQGDYAGAEPPLEQARLLCESSGNRIEALACLTHRALIVANQGDLRQSMALSREVMQRSRELRLHRYFIDAANNLAEDYAAFGRLHESAEAAEEGLSAAASLPDRYHLGVVCTTLALTCFHLRRADVSDRLVGRLLDLGFGSPVSGDDVDLLWMRAYQAAVHGEPARAAELLESAQHRFLERGIHLAEPELVHWRLLFAIRAGRLDDAARGLAGLGTADGPPTLLAGLAHARAALAHARGDAEGARQTLNELILGDVAPWSALATMDAAWLAIEAGDLSGARQRLDGLGAWRDEHPVAQAVEARWHAARGDMVSALMYQRRYEAVATAPAARPLGELGRHYEAAADGQPAVLPAAPWLVTLW